MSDNDNENNNSSKPEPLALEAIEAWYNNDLFKPEKNQLYEPWAGYIAALIAEIRKLRSDYEKHTANLNRIIDSNHREIAGLKAEVRKATLVEAALKTCWMCAEGKRELKISNGGYFHKSIQSFIDGGYLVPCHAQAIHLLIAEDQGQGKAK